MWIEVWEALWVLLNLDNKCSHCRTQRRGLYLQFCWLSNARTRTTFSKAKTLRRSFKRNILFSFDRSGILYWSNFGPISKRLDQLFPCSTGKLSRWDSCAVEGLKNNAYDSRAALETWRESISPFGRNHREALSASLSESGLENKGLELMYSGVICM